MEATVEYRTRKPIGVTVKEPNPSGIPSRWLRFLYRVAGLQVGRVYTITLFVRPNCEPQWSISDGGPIENG